VREAAWALSAAAIERRVQQAREASAALLEADVGRRVEAGDLAPVDRLAARTERLAALGALREAEAREREAASRLRTITGMEGAGELVESPREGAQAESLLPDAQALERHPVLAVAREALDTAWARLDAARASRRDAPTLSAAARFDRDAYGGDYRNSVRIGIVVPLDTEARNAPRLAAAGVEAATLAAVLAQFTPSGFSPSLLTPSQFTPSQLMRLIANSPLVATPASGSEPGGGADHLSAILAGARARVRRSLRALAPLHRRSAKPIFACMRAPDPRSHRALAPLFKRGGKRLRQRHDGGVALLRLRRGPRRAVTVTGHLPMRARPSLGPSGVHWTPR
jgi:hypothetical protein